MIEPSKKKRPRASQMQQEERKQQLLRAGVDCFAAKGIGGTRHADLARACSVSVPTVFFYFSNRDALVTAILDEVGSTMLESVVTPAQALPNPAERLRATAPLFTDYAAREPNYVKVWLMWSMHFAPGIQNHFKGFEGRFIDAIAEMIRQGTPVHHDDQDLQDRARVLIAASAFLAKMVFDDVSEKRRDEFVQHMLSSLIEAGK